MCLCAYVYLCVSKKTRCLPDRRSLQLRRKPALLVCPACPARRSFHLRRLVDNDTFLTSRRPAIWCTALLVCPYVPYVFPKNDQLPEAPLVVVCNYCASQPCSYALYALCAYMHLCVSKKRSATRSRPANLSTAGTMLRAAGIKAPREPIGWALASLWARAATLRNQPILSTGFRVQPTGSAESAPSQHLAERGAAL